MKERPILFSGEMVRKILSDDKRQTRRLIKPEWWRCLDPEDAADRAKALTMCPYGVVGDRLWVRETFYCDHSDSHNYVAGPNGDKRDTPSSDRMREDWLAMTYYAADYETPSAFAKLWEAEVPKWTPGIHMPRWASRITLEVTEVRVQRLQQISEEDALAEGLRARLPNAGLIRSDFTKYVRDVFSQLWDEINGERAPWDSNPWVWAISFKRVEQEVRRG